MQWGGLRSLFLRNDSDLAGILCISDTDLEKLLNTNSVKAEI